MTSTILRSPWSYLALSSFNGPVPVLAWRYAVLDCAPVPYQSAGLWPAILNPGAQLAGPVVWHTNMLGETIDYMNITQTAVLWSGATECKLLELRGHAGFDDERLVALAELRDGWDGGDELAPAASARAAAAMMLAETGLHADRVLAVRDGGVALYFIGTGQASRRIARVEYTNDGDVILSLEDRGAGTVVVSDQAGEEPVRTLARQIRSHVGLADAEAA